MDLNDLKRQVAAAQLKQQVRDGQSQLTASQNDTQKKKDQELQDEINRVIEAVNKQILQRKNKPAIIFSYGGACSGPSRGIGKAVLNHVIDTFGQEYDIYEIREGRKHDYDSTYGKLSRNSMIYDCGQIAIQNKNGVNKIFNGPGGNIDPTIINDLYH